MRGRGWGKGQAAGGRRQVAGIPLCWRACIDQAGEDPQDLVAFIDPSHGNRGLYEPDSVCDLALSGELGDGSAGDEQEANCITIRAALASLRDIACNADGRSSDLIPQAPILAKRSIRTFAVNVYREVTRACPDP